MPTEELKKLLEEEKWDIKDVAKVLTDLYIENYLKEDL